MALLYKIIELKSTFTSGNLSVCPISKIVLLNFSLHFWLFWRLNGETSIIFDLLTYKTMQLKPGHEIYCFERRKIMEIRTMSGFIVPNILYCPTFLRLTNGCNFRIFQYKAEKWHFQFNLVLFNEIYTRMHKR